MFAFVARQPILDREKEVFAYELLFRDGKGNCYPDVEKTSNKVKSQRQLTLGLDEISCNKTSFVSLNRDTLVKGMPSSLEPDSVIIELGADASLGNGLEEACKLVKSNGFRLALDYSAMNGDQHLILPHLDVIKVDVMQSDYEAIADNVPKFADANVKLIADNVETPQDFGIYRDMGFDYFQGYFFSRPESIKQQNLPTSKLTMVELIGESSSEDFELDRINQIIERDVGLSYLLLRFINNPTINKRYKISSLRHALNYLGEVEIKKFIALLALANLSDEKPVELTHLSLVRAKFCDLVAQERGVGSNPPSGFLVGLFSLLDGLLDQSMHNLLEQIPLAEDVKVALCGGQNEFALYLMLVKSFESATWLKVKRIADMLNIDQKRLHSLFNESIVWGNGVRQSISPHYPVSKP